MKTIADKSCERCGYDLTGLAYEGRCPECGSYFDAWSGEGVADGARDKLRRNDWVIRLFQMLGLLFLAVLILAIGALYSWKSNSYTPIIFTGVVSSLFPVSAVVTGVSLRRL